MIDTLFDLIGMNFDTFHLSPDVVFVCTFLIILFCLGYVFNFFQTLIERCTAKRR